MAKNILLCIFLPVLHSSLQVTEALPHKAIYWEVAPFIFTENGKMRGMIYDYYQKMKRDCSPTQDLVNFTLNMKNEQQLQDLLENHNITYASDGTLKNIKKNEATWLPLLRTHVSLARDMKREVFLYSPYIAVIAKRDQIELTYKLWLGIQNCRHVIVLAAIMTAFVAIMIWLLEWFGNPEFSKSFIVGGGKGLWWAVVTMTTVGYGDAVPRSFLARLFAMAWMVIGLIIASLITASVSESLGGVSHLEFTKDTKVAVLKNSFTSFIVKQNYQVILKEYNSYLEVLEAVKNEDVLTAVMNSDIVAYYQDNITDTDSRPLAIVRLLNLHTPVQIGYAETPQYTQNFTTCALIRREQTLNDVIYAYRKIVKVQVMYVASLYNLFKENDFIKFSTIAVAGLVVGGLIFEIYWRTKNYVEQRKNRIPETGQEVYQNGSAKGNMDAPKNATKLETEMMRLRTDVAIVKEQIFKLSTMTQYKQRCSVCSWQA